MAQRHNKEPPALVGAGIGLGLWLLVIAIPKLQQWLVLAALDGPHVARQWAIPPLRSIASCLSQQLDQLRPVHHRGGAAPAGRKLSAEEHRSWAQ